MNTPKHILFTGGGTLGPVTPLLAVVARWKKQYPETRMTWVGTPYGPERALVEAAKIPFIPFSAPKFDRTRWWTWIILPCSLAVSCIRAAQILAELRPTLMMTAGAYVSVPFAWVGRFFGMKTWVHQLDVVPGLANKLMAPFATRISVTWEENVKDFGAQKTFVVGAMVRPFLHLGDALSARTMFGLNDSKPTVLVLGGGTGAMQINEAMNVIAKDLLVHANVIHVMGPGKVVEGLADVGEGYCAREFLAEGMADAYAVADVVVSRAGMGTIAELVALGKAAVLVPLAGHQDMNAKALEGREAAEVLRHVTPQTLLQSIMRLLESTDRRTTLSQNIQKVFPVNGDERIVQEAVRIFGRAESAAGSGRYL